MANYLVTGGAGFIGSNLVKYLVEQGESVRAVDNFITGRRKNLEGYYERIDFIEGDILDEEVLGRALDDIDYVLHQAAIPSVQRSVENPIRSNDANITGTLKLLEGARKAGIKRLVYASSSSAYGDQPAKLKSEELKAMPLSPYAITKLTGEYYCGVYARIFELETVSLRYFNVFGPNQDPKSEYSAVIPRFVTAVLQDRRPIIYGDGHQSRDFTFVENNVKANILAAKSTKGAGQTVNIACGTNYSLHDLLRIIGEVTGKKIEPEYAPARKGDVKHSLADISRARELLGYEVAVSFEEGIRRTIEWYKKELEESGEL